MSFYRRVYNRYHPAVWVRFWGTTIQCITGFALYPYIMLYMTEHLHASPVEAAGALSFPSLVAIFLRLWIGKVSDRYGRRFAMLSGLALEFFVISGMIFATEVWHFYALLSMNALATNLSIPAGSALIADIVPEERRAESYALIKTGIHLGVAFGPMLGILIYSTNPKVAFMLEAMAILFYLLLVYFKIPETLPKKTEASSVSTSSTLTQTSSSRFLMLQYLPLVLLILTTIPVYMLETQQITNIPLYLKSKFANFLVIYATLRTFNGLITAFLQVPIARWTESWASARAIFIGYLLFALFGIGYGLAPVFIVLLIAELFYLVGGMLLFPHQEKVISIIAPENKRGQFFSLFEISFSAGKMTGPVVGSLILVEYGGETLFVGLASLLMIAGIAQYILINRILSKHEKKSLLPSQEVNA